MIAAALVVLTAALMFGVLRRLPGASWIYRSPRLGILAWYSVLATVPTAAGAVTGEFLLPWHGGPDLLCDAGILCAEPGDERHRPLAWFLARLLAAAALLAITVIAIRATAGAQAVVRRRRRHRDILRITGRRCGTRDVTVIEDPRPAVYLAPGRPRRVVVTSGALHRLDPGELAAVLAHERAHATGRHQTLLDIVHIAARVFPRRLLITTAAAQIERLVEMRADEVAAATHPPMHLARAIVAMAGGANAVPGHLPAVTGGDTIERLHRLMRPPRRLPRAGRAAILGAIPLLPVAPLALAATCRWWPVLSSCLWDL